MVIAYLMYTKCMSDIAVSPTTPHPFIISLQYPAFFFFFPFSLKRQIFLESVKQIIEQLVLAVFSLRVELQPSAWDELISLFSGLPGNKVFLWINTICTRAFWRPLFLRPGSIPTFVLGTFFRDILPFTFVFCSLWLPLVAFLQSCASAVLAEVDN